MITVYTWTTPNGRKVPIMLEELGWAYRVRPINIGQDEQFTQEFLAISPNNKIPAIVDDEAEGGAPLSIFESGAILIYLADKSGQFLPASGPARYKTLEWVQWQVANQGPMFGQLGFFAIRSPEKAPLAIKRFTDEAERLLGVMERQLSRSTYLAGDEYTIADIISYPWMVTATTMQKDLLGASVASKPAICRWMKALGERPAVQRGMAVPKV